MKITHDIIKKGSLICLFFVLALSGCKTNKEATFKLAGNALGTTYHITYIGKAAPTLQSEIDDFVVTFNQALSTYQDNSLISGFNQNNPAIYTNPQLEKIYPLFITMVNMSRRIYSETEGAFDPTAAPLFKLYSEAKKAGVYMDSLAVNLAMESTGMDKVALDSIDRPYKLDSNVTLNFNAIAKGYLVDCLGKLIEEKTHSSNYMVEVGGELIAKGKNTEEKPWRIGINTPTIKASPDDFFEVIELTDRAMATSGNYKNYYMVNGEIVGHTLDPRTGKPVISDLKSATIMHASCATADAYATACMVLGLDASRKLIQSDTSLSAYFIYEKDGELTGEHVE